MTRTWRGGRRLRRQAGFSLIELLVALVLATGVIVAALALFDFHNKVSRVEMQVVEMQQSLRVAQYSMVRLVRMAGRGGLPAVKPAGALLPGGVAVAVRDAVGDPAYIAPGDASSPVVLPGTDVLTVRGVFSTPIYQIKYAGLTNGASLQFTYDGAAPASPEPARANGGTIEICAISPSGVRQDLQPLLDRIAALPPRPEALVLVSPLDDGIYGVVELDPAASARTAARCVPGQPDSGVTLAFRAVRGTHDAAYRALSPAGVGENLPARLTSVAYVGLLEEHRFYVHAFRPGTGELAPRLTRARFYPGTDATYAGDAANLREGLADNIVDLQVALGVDTDEDQQIAEGQPDKKTDEWLLNDPADLPRAGRLYYARLSTLARTGRRDRDYVAPLLAGLEDRAYGSGPSDPINGTTERMFRRRLMQTVVDLRNL